MSDNIPFEIQAEIIKRLPVKTLIQFRSVSKPWKSFIDSSEFIADYHVTHTQPQQLLVRYVNAEDFGQRFVSFVDDDTFPTQKISLTAPISINLLYEPRIVGSSQGLICFYSYMEKPSVTGTKTAIIWNPSIRKTVDIVVPNALSFPYQTFVGFGVCPKTNDPKLVKITNNHTPLVINSVTCIPWQVEVFTLSSGAWRSPYINAPRKAVVLSQSLRVIDGFIYWLAYGIITANVEYKWYDLIMSFNITSEEFTEIYLPDCLSHDPVINLYMSTQNVSLVVLEFNYEKRVYGVWIMEHGSPKSFTKLFTINIPDALIGSSRVSIGNVVGFRSGGEPIVQMIFGLEEQGILFVYDPHSEQVKCFGIYGEGFSFLGSSYTQTLLLLDH